MIQSENMESYDKIHFVVMAIEAGARKLGIPASEMESRLCRQGLIQSHLLKHYDLLHTQSLDWVADDIVETLINWEKSA